MGTKDEVKKTTGNKRLRAWESPSSLEDLSTPKSSLGKNGPKNPKSKEKKAGKRKSSISSSSKVKANGSPKKSPSSNQDGVTKSSRPKSLKFLTRLFMTAIEKKSSKSLHMNLDVLAEEMKVPKSPLMKIASIMEGVGLADVNDSAFYYKKEGFKQNEKFILVCSFAAPKDHYKHFESRLSIIKVALNQNVIDLAAKRMGAKKGELVLTKLELTPPSSSRTLEFRATIKVEKMYASAIAKERFDQVVVKMLKVDWNDIVTKVRPQLAKLVPQVQWSSFQGKLLKSTQKEENVEFEKGLSLLRKLEAKLDKDIETANETTSKLLSDAGAFLTVKDLVASSIVPNYVEDAGSGTSVVVRMPRGTIVAVPSMTSNIERKADDVKENIALPELYRYQIQVQSKTGERIQPMLIAAGEASGYSCNGEEEASKEEDGDSASDLNFDSAVKEDRVGRFGGKLAFKALQFLSGTLVSDQEALEMHRLISLETSTMKESIMGPNDTIVEGKPLELIPLHVESRSTKKTPYTSWYPRHRSGHRNAATLKHEHDEDGMSGAGARVRWLQYTCDKTNIPYFYDRKTGEVRWDYPPIDEEIMKIESRKGPVPASPKKALSSSVKKTTKKSGSLKGKKGDQSKKRKGSVDRKIASPKRKRKSLATSPGDKKKRKGDVPKAAGVQQAQQAMQPVHVYPGFNMQMPNQFYQMQNNQMQPVVYIQPNQNGQPTMFMAPPQYQPQQQQQQQDAATYAAATAARQAALLAGYSPSATNAATKAAVDAARSSSAGANGQNFVVAQRDIARTAREAADRASKENADAKSNPADDEGAGNQIVNKDDARLFLNVVRNTFLSQPTRYLEFLKILKEFHEDKLDADKVVDVVNRLFGNQDHLKTMFKRFVPDWLGTGKKDKDKPKSTKSGSK